MATQPEPSERAGGRGAAVGVGAVLLAVLCCAGPALLAAGALGVVAGVLRNPLVLTAAAAVLTAALMITLRRRRTGTPCNVPAAPPPTEMLPATPPQLNDLSAADPTTCRQED